MRVLRPAVVVQRQGANLALNGEQILGLPARENIAICRLDK